MNGWPGRDEAVRRRQLEGIWDLDDPPPGARCYFGDKLLVVPAPNDAAPVVSAVMAAEVAAEPYWHDSGPPEAELMVATGDFGAPPAPGRPRDQWLSDRLVWVLTWTDVHGGSSFVDAEEERQHRWIGTGIVDAISGQMLVKGERAERRPE